MRPLLRILLMTMMSCILISGCNLSEKHATRQLLKKMIGSTVVLPEKVTCIQGGNSFPMPETLRTTPKFIVFVDSTECSMCRIDKLVHYKDLLEMSHETGAFEVFIILSIRESEYKHIFDHLLYSEHEFPIYLDEQASFRKLNPIIPDITAFHTLFVDRDNSIILVGDPVYNEQIMNLFHQVIIP